MVFTILGGAGGQAIAAVTYGLVAILAARAAGPALFGQLMIMSACALVGGDVLDFGRSTLLVRLTAERGTPFRHEMWALISSKCKFSLLLAAGLCGLDYLVTSTIHWYTLWFALYGLLYTIWQTLSIPLRAEARLSALASCSLQERIVAVLTIVPLLKFFPEEALPIALSLGACTVAGRLIFTWSQLPQGSAIYTPSGLRRNARSYGAISLISDAQQLDTLILGSLGVPALAGLYASASRLISPLSLLLNQISPYVFAKAARKDSKSMTAFQLVTLIGGILCIYAPLLVAFSIFGREIISVLLGAEFIEAGRLMPILSLGIAIAAISGPVTAWMQARGHQRVSAVAGFLAVGSYLSITAVGAHRDSLLIVAFGFPLMQTINLLIQLLVGAQAPTRTALLSRREHEDVAV